MNNNEYSGVDAPVFTSYIEKGPEDPDDRISMDPEDGKHAPEGILKRALALEEAAGRMLLAEYRARYYNVARQMLQPLYPEWKPCVKDYWRIRRKMYKARVECRIELYDKACALRDAASTPEDFQYAGAIFSHLSWVESKRKITPRYTDPEMYEEAMKRCDYDEQAAYCEQQKRKLVRKKANRLWLILAAVLILVLGGLASSRTAPFLNIKGDIYSTLGMHDKAWQAYDVSRQKSGDEGVYEKYKAARYQAAAEFLEDGKYATARDYYQALAAKDFQDSRQKFADCEQLVLQEKEIGNELTFGRAQWLVMDKTEDAILLLRRDSYGDLAANTDGGPVTWETSSIREYLNTTYLEEKFYPEEVAMLADTSVETGANPISGRSGGNTVTDKVFLLSAEEAEAYREQFRDTKFGWWLRTPGAAEDALAFVNVDREVMISGYDAASAEIRVKPAMWVKLK